MQQASDSDGCELSLNCMNTISEFGSICNGDSG